MLRCPDNSEFEKKKYSGSTIAEVAPLVGCKPAQVLASYAEVRKGSEKKKEGVWTAKKAGAGERNRCISL